MPINIPVPLTLGIADPSTIIAVAEKPITRHSASNRRRTKEVNLRTDIVQTNVDWNSSSEFLVAESPNTKTSASNKRREKERVENLAVNRNV